MNLSVPGSLSSPVSSPSAAPCAADRVLASELAGRGDVHDALSMMVSSMVRMVQAGKTRESRWKDS
ncbi:hypothetical protein [Aphanothece stagnina]|uniref:hypothetical protein n=1 Tax=Aphanothece stagnina TaxID=1004305 RepID=UPI00398F2981